MSFKEFLTQFILITLSVLLAFGLNNWYENKQEAKEAQLYLDGIKEEIDFNIQQLEVSLPYHQNLLRLLINVPDSAKMVLNAAKLSDVAWGLAENPIFKSHTDPELYRQLAQAYELQSLLQEHAKKAGRLMAETNIWEPYYVLQVLNEDIPKDKIDFFKRRSKQSWTPIFETWVSWEGESLKRLKALQQELQ